MMEYTVLHESHLNRSYVSFNELYGNNVSKFIAVAFSMVSVAFITPLMYIIVSFETNNNYRILIGRLISSNIISLMCWNMTVQVFAWVLYFHGPMPELLCHLDSSLRNIFIMRLLILLDTIIIVRYIFTFHSKNPTAVQDEFWTQFVNVLGIGYGVIGQLAQTMLPGKDPHMLFICMGKMPSRFLGEKVKFNRPYFYLIHFSAILHLILLLRFSVFKIQDKMKNKVSPSVNSVALKKVDKESLFSYSSQVMFVLLILFSVINTSNVNGIESVSIDVYPNYLWVYALHHFTPQGIFITVVIIFYARNELLRQFSRRKLCELFSRNSCP